MSFAPLKPTQASAATTQPRHIANGGIAPETYAYDLLSDLPKRVFNP